MRSRLAPLLSRAEASQPPPREVCALRKSIGQSDGVVIASPEYAHGVPGSSKHALDWLVGSVEFPGKPVAVINTSPRAIHADAQLREILIAMSAKLIEMGPIAVPYDAKEIAFDLTLSDKLRAALSDLIEAMQAP
ncbi:NADPH-dependent FMN reductase [Methylocystis hirsuta]|uniref:NADPH-dependent FMN reductase n=1 Tax=Methylocystis hirsuta TaxID=369798 RepID=UPI00315CF1EE